MEEMRKEENDTGRAHAPEAHGSPPDRVRVRSRRVRVRRARCPGRRAGRTTPPVLPQPVSRPSPRQSRRTPSPPPARRWWSPTCSSLPPLALWWRGDEGRRATPRDGEAPRRHFALYRAGLAPADCRRRMRLPCCHRRARSNKMAGVFAIVESDKTTIILYIG